MSLTGTATHIQQERERERERGGFFLTTHPSTLYTIHPPPLVPTSIPASIMLDSSHLGHLLFFFFFLWWAHCGRPAAAAGVVVSRRSFEFGVIREREREREPPSLFSLSVINNGCGRYFSNLFPKRSFFFSKPNLPFLYCTHQSKLHLQTHTSSGLSSSSSSSGPKKKKKKKGTLGGGGDDKAGLSWCCLCVSMVGFCYMCGLKLTQKRERERTRCKRVERRNLSVKTQTGPGEKMGQGYM